jgi:hypothetical protein
MTTKLVSDLHFKKSSEPIPTVEIDVDSISGIEIIRAVRRTLATIASKNQKMRATLYTYATLSSNFHEMTNSDFVGVVGSVSILDKLHSELARLGARVRMSDYILTRESRMAYHIEDGALWVPEDWNTWIVIGIQAEESKDWEELSSKDDTVPDIRSDEEILCESSEDEDALAPVSALSISVSTSNTVPARHGAARSDASIGSIKKEIEAVFGLPEGSVSLCEPNGKALRANALIATLQRRWNFSSHQVLSPNGGGSTTPVRYRATRSDASIGSIKNKIETVFDLPEGAVVLCGPDGKTLRSDALIATLRRRWEI